MARLQLHQALKLSQTLKLTPQLQLAMKMLQLNQLELAELIKQEVEKNPLLEIVDREHDPKEMSKTALETPNEIKTKSEEKKAEVAEKEPEKAEEKDNFDDDYFDYLIKSQDNQYSGGASASSYNPDDESNLEEYVAAEISLTDHLLNQLRLRPYDEETEKILEYLIACLDVNGYLRYEEEQILEVLGCDEDVLDLAIGKLQSFDPPGIAARNLAECLLLQYQSLHDVDPFVMTVIRNYLEDLAANRIKQIASAEGVDLESVLEARDEIRKLDPKPGLHFGGGGNKRGDGNRYVKPDVLVYVDDTKEDEDERLVVELLKGEVPTLKINGFYEKMLRAKEHAPKKTLSYIRERLQAARFIQESIMRRRDTIERVTRSIFEVQIGFFEDGVKGLKPLVLKTIAEKCDLHESTVSRVTNSKYVQTPRGLFPLKFFFSSGTTTSDGEDISSRHIKRLIRELIEKENPKKPLSDSKLQKALEAEGVKIARRTVAKYREELDIPSSSKRKQFV